MKYFTQQAAFTYLALTEISYENYLISIENYYERLQILKQFSDSTEKDTIENIEIYISDIKGYYRFLEHNEYHYKENSDAILSSESEIDDKAGDSTKQEVQGENPDPIFHFITSTSGKISKWDFHKTDSDPYPSIPHGHAIINHNIKLDAYRGYIYRNNKHNGRETKQFIIDLWNDNKFRDVAREIIVYYLTTYPLYNWKVADPLRLPKRRRL